jgi:putative SOS response-associated peptidase YedK
VCGRFNLRLTPAELQEFFDIVRAVPQFAPRYNIAPTQQILYIPPAPDGRECKVGPWGIRPVWKPTVPLINARSETAFESRTFAKLLKTQRCIVPVSGFYEWKTEGKAKRPFHIWLKSGEPMAFAAFHDADGAVCTMTTGPNAEMATIHDRMPVILPRDAWTLYLDPAVTDPEAIRPLLVPLPAGSLTMQAVNPVVNNARNESPDCIASMTDEKPAAGELL